MRFRLFVFLILCGLIAGSGCSHYQLGTDAKLAFSSLYIAPAESKTLLPQARALITTQVREAFERDGRVTLVNSPESADATLHLTLRDYHREMASVLENDTGLARKFTLTLNVAATLTQRNGQNLFTDRIVRVQRDAFTDLGQLQSEYQTLPLLAEALAKKVVHTVLDVW